MIAGNKRQLYRAGTLAAFVLLATLGLSQSQQPAAAETKAPNAAAEKARLAKLDAGPKTIDVSNYAADMKAAYPIVAKKCSKCHVFARAVNAPFVAPAEWVD